MQARIIAALLVLGGVATGADAITVRANVGGVELPACSNAANVSFKSGSARADMRFSYECPSEGIARTCAPAAYAQPGGTPGAGTPGETLLQNLQTGDPAFVYQAASGNPTITVVCDDGAGGGIPTPVIKGTEIVGTLDGVPFVGCHPAINFQHASQTAAVVMTKEPVSNCPTSAGPIGNYTATCLRYQCPGDTEPKACFPLSQMAYTGRLPSDHSALRRVTVDCESQAPMLSDSFD